nr:putative late blight resistance protein homolog R1B-8 [Ipomoea trifida]
MWERQWFLTERGNLWGKKERKKLGSMHEGEGQRTKGQDLTSDIETFNAQLVDASMNPRANQLQVVKVVVKKFRAVVNEAQDAVAKYIALNKKHEDNALAKCLDFIPFPVCENTNVHAIRTKVKALFQVHEKDLVSLVSYKNNAQDNNGLKPLQVPQKLFLTYHHIIF